VPIVDVAYQPRVTEQEPYDGDLRPGDVIIRFLECGPFDSADLSLAAAGWAQVD